MLICLHVGANATDCSLLQSRIFAERDAIQRRKIRYLTHDYTREKLTDPLDAVRNAEGGGYGAAEPGLAKTFARMVRAHAVRERLILSDERLSGVIVDERGLYPELRKRMQALRRSAPEVHDVAVFFAIRDYAPFFDDLVLRRLAADALGDAEAVRTRAAETERGWADVAADLCATFRPERTTIWTYEAFRESPDRVSAALLGDADTTLFPGGAIDDPKPLSRKAVAVLQHTSAALSTGEYAQFARSLREFSFSPPDEPFSCFDEAARSALADRYAGDLQKIAALGCTLIDADRSARSASSAA